MLASRVAAALIAAAESCHHRAMRNPARKVLYCLVALLAGVALIRFGALREARIGEHWTAIAPLALGFTLAPLGCVFLIQALFAMRGRALLLAGKRVIARWHVPAADWDRFRDVDGRRSSEDFSLGNDLWIRRSTPPEGVEVVVGEKGLLIDGSYHGLSPRGLPELREARWLAGSPDCLEFALLYPRGRYGGTVPMTLRVPVPASARGTAQRVLDHYQPLCRRTPGLALRNPPRTYRVCGALLALALCAGAAGYALAGSDGTLVAPALLIGGTILAVFAIILAIATLLLTRPGNR